MRILLIRYSSLGDVVLASAVPCAIRARYADAHITVLTKDKYLPLVEHFAGDVTVVGVTDERALRDSLTELRGQRFDHIIDLHSSLRSRIVARLVSSQHHARIDKQDQRRRMMVTKKQGLDKRLSVVANYLAAVHESLSIPLDGTPCLVLTPEEKLRATGLKRELMDAIGIGWGARWPTKVVPPELMEDAITRLSGKGITAVRLFGLDEDAKDMISFREKILQRVRGVTVQVHASLPLSDVLVHLSACRAYIGSDSGLTHMAAALGVPTVSVFGPTHPSLGFAPIGSHTRALHAGTWCSPCHKHGSAPCFRDRRHCFDELSGHGVADAVDELLKEEPPS